MESILIVEDNRAMGEMLKTILSEEGYEILWVENGADALIALSNKIFSLILSDFQLPDITGLDLFERINDNQTPFIILTAYGSIETAVKAVKKGVFDFIAKPVNPEYLKIQIRKALESQRLLKENSLFKELITKNENPIIGIDKSLKDVGIKLKQAAPTDFPVLILGESGTGKELFAKALHNLSHRKNAPFIALNSAAIPENLLENELFGHEKGSYTDAISLNAGKLELCQGGTFFLDEIGDLPLALQSKLLRVVEEKRFYRLGGQRYINLDIRFLFATNKNLEEACQKGEFRRDLFYRINIFPIELPPLRKRSDDLELLANFFIKKSSCGINKGKHYLSESALNKLKEYSWPGNVRELQNTIERAVILSANKEITQEEIIIPGKKNLDKDNFNLNGDLKEVSQRAIKKVETLKIKETLKNNNYNKTSSAKELNISYKTLLEKIKNYEIE